MPLGTTLKLGARHVSCYSARFKKIVKQRVETTGGKQRFCRTTRPKSQRKEKMARSKLTILLSLFILLIMEMILCNSFLFCSGPRHPPIQFLWCSFEGRQVRFSLQCLCPSSPRY